MRQLLAAPPKTGGANGRSKGNLPSPQTLSQVAGGMPHPLIGSPPSTPCEPGPCLLVRCNNAMELQRSPAPNDGPVVSTAVAADRIIETSIPARLDALPWSGFHTRVVLALGITWILD